MDIEGIAKDLCTSREEWRKGDGHKRLDRARIETASGRHHVWGTVEGVERVVFSYYPDELSFSAQEFEGKTIEQARKLHYDRDVAWLRS